MLCFWANKFAELSRPAWCGPEYHISEKAIVWFWWGSDHRQGSAKGKESPHQLSLGLTCGVREDGAAVGGQV